MEFKEEKEIQYELDDNSFGLSTAALIANNVMANNRIDPVHGPAVLEEILLRWPDAYSAGGRLAALVTLINGIAKKYFVVISILIIFYLATTTTAAPSNGLITVEPAKIRIRTLARREGFGPWEANDAWDEKGKSNIAPVIKQAVEAIVAEEKVIQKILNKTVAIVEETIEIIEHPVAELKKSFAGWVILILAFICLTSIILRIALPLLKAIWKVYVMFVGYIVIPIFDFLATLSCSMAFCALRPFVAFRNSRRRNKLEKEALRHLQVYNPSEAIQMIKKTESALYTDEKGAYLLADENHRVYLKNETAVEDILMMRALGGVNRERDYPTESLKESVLSTSKLYKIDKVPDFQGTFEVDGNLIGHFSRIKYNGLDCLLTAYHVLDYNRTALINLRKGEKCVKFASVKATVVAASHTDHLDFIILAIPACVFSTLGLKVGTWTSRVQPREPVQIFQFYEGRPCVSSAAIRISSSKVWHINYAASTTIGTSGAPVLDSKNRIIGVHLEHDSVTKTNVGVIPPVFRMNKKESPTNEDIANGQPEMELYIHDDDEEYVLDDDYYEMEAYETYLTKLEDQIANYEAGISWGDFMDEREQSAASKMRDKFGDRYDVYKTKTGVQGTHVGHRIKGDRYRNLETLTRKESPWSCSQCACVQNKGYNCINCGYALIKASKATIEKQELGTREAEAILRTKLPVEISDSIIKEVLNDNLLKRISLQVAKLLKAGEDPAIDGIELRERVTVGLYPDLPSDRAVPIQKKLVQKLRTAATLSAPLKVEGNVLKTVEPTLLDGHDFMTDGLTLIRKAVVKVDPKKETKVTYEMEGFGTPTAGSLSTEPTQRADFIEAPPAQQASSDQPARVLSKSAKRRLRLKKAQSAVPLNFLAPATSGAPTTSGTMKQPLSPSNQKKSVVAPSVSVAQGNAKNQQNGKTSAKGDQSTRNTHGHRGEQTQKSAASSSNVTNTL